MHPGKLLQEKRHRGDGGTTAATRRGSPAITYASIYVYMYICIKVLKKKIFFFGPHVNQLPPKRAVQPGSSEEEGRLERERMRKKGGAPCPQPVTSLPFN